jgi:hypothetical protein
MNKQGDTENTMMRTYSPFHLMLRPLAWLAAAALMAAVLAITAFASDDPGLVTIGGEAAGDISGYVITDVHYQLDEANPSLIRAVSFAALGGDGQTRPTTVGVALGPGQPTSTCWATAGDKWTCPVSFPVADASALRVVAAR